MLPGPFAYAERWDEAAGAYLGLAIDHASNVMVVIDGDSLIIKPDAAESHRPKPTEPAEFAPVTTQADPLTTPPTTPGGQASSTSFGTSERTPTRFSGVVSISPDRPARDMHQIVEAIVEQLTTLPGNRVTLRLEIDAEVPGGLDRAKVRTLIENANTLGFSEKLVE
jgi:hypothetical protein